MLTSEPAAKLSIPENFTTTLTIDPKSRGSLDAFWARMEAAYYGAPNHRRTVRKAKLAVTHDIQATHDQHANAKNAADAHTTRQAVHHIRQTAKIALRSNPATRAAHLASLNAGPHARHHQSALNNLIVDFIAQSVSPTDAVGKATQTLTQIWQDAAYGSALKAHRAGRVYPA